MSTSKMMAQRFAIDLSGMALGMWETARLLSKKQTQDEGKEKLEWLKSSLDSFKQRSTLSDSLAVTITTTTTIREYDTDLPSVEFECFNAIW